MFHRQYGLGWFHIDLDTVTGNGLLENSIGCVIFPMRTDKKGDANHDYMYLERKPHPKIGVFETIEPEEGDSFPPSGKTTDFFVPRQAINLSA